MNTGVKVDDRCGSYPTPQCCSEGIGSRYKLLPTRTVTQHNVAVKFCFVTDNLDNLYRHRMTSSLLSRREHDDCIDYSLSYAWMRNGQERAWKYSTTVSASWTTP